MRETIPAQAVIDPLVCHCYTHQLHMYPCAQSAVCHQLTATAKTRQGQQYKWTIIETKRGAMSDVAFLMTCH